MMLCLRRDRRRFMKVEWIEFNSRHVYSVCGVSAPGSVKRRVGAHCSRMMDEITGMSGYHRGFVEARLTHGRMLSLPVCRGLTIAAWLKPGRRTRTPGSAPQCVPGTTRRGFVEARWRAQSPVRPRQVSMAYRRGFVEVRIESSVTFSFSVVVPAALPLRLR